MIYNEKGERLYKEYKKKNVQELIEIKNTMKDRKEYSYLKRESVLDSMGDVVTYSFCYLP